MEKLHLCVIPSAGIHWLHVLRDPCLRRDDGEEAFFDTLVGGNPSSRSAEEKQMKRPRSGPKRRFALCLKNDGCDDLETRKIYQVLSDDEAAKEGYMRIIDESGEGYLYPESYFVFVDLPKEAEAALSSAG